MRKPARISAVLPWIAGLAAGYLAYLAAVSLARTEMESLFMGVIAAVAATLFVETWQGNRRARAQRRRRDEPPKDP